MKREDVDYLRYVVEEEAGLVACGIDCIKALRCECMRCRELLALAGGKRGFEVLIAHEVINQLINEYGDELNDDLFEVFNSVKNLKAFQNKSKAKCFI
jgi:hypothetical protein